MEFFRTLVLVIFAILGGMGIAFCILSVWGWDWDGKLRHIADMIGWAGIVINVFIWAGVHWLPEPPALGHLGHFAFGSEAWEKMVALRATVSIGFFFLPAAGARVGHWLYGATATGAQKPRTD